MFQSFLNTATTLTANSAIPFASNTIQSWQVNHLPGNTAINIRCPGLYLVQFNADVTVATTAPVTLQLNVDSTALPEAQATATVTADEVVNMAFSTFVTVRPYYYGALHSLTVTANAAATINFANIIIRRVQ